MDDLTDIKVINDQRPMYSSSSTLEDQFKRLNALPQTINTDEDEDRIEMLKDRINRDDEEEEEKQGGKKGESSKMVYQRYLQNTQQNNNLNSLVDVIDVDLTNISSITSSSSSSSGSSSSKSDGQIEKRKRFIEEEDEDILRESDDRFVLFPIKYHEVSFYHFYSSLLRLLGEEIRS